MQKMVEVIERTFEVGEQPHLSLSNIRGAVEIQAGNGGSIHVEAVIHTQDGDQEHTHVVLEQPDENTVKVETRYDAPHSVFKRKPCRVEYRVRVPDNCSLDISAVSNSTTIQGMLNGCKLSGVSGSVTLDAMQGEISASTVSGALKARSLQGNLKWHTVSGVARITDSQFEEVQADTVSGNVKLETSLGAGPYYFHTISGNVNLYIPAETAYVLSSKSMSGKVLGRQHYASGSPIRFESVSGNMHIHESGEEATEEQHDQPLGDEERMRILESIERGEMSTEEAIKALSG